MADEENSNAAEDSAPTTSNKEILRMLVRLRLKFIINYILDIIVPAVAVIALIVAVMSFNDNHSSQSQLDKNTEIMDRLNSSLSASSAELEKLKSTVAQDKTMQEEARKKQAEEREKIVQSISQLQSKMKISPTLEEQLRQSLAGSAVVSSVAGTAASSVASAAAAPSVASAISAASAVTSVTAMPAATPPAKASDKKPGSQAQVLTEAIEKFNQKKHK